MRWTFSVVTYERHSGHEFVLLEQKSKYYSNFRRFWYLAGNWSMEIPVPEPSWYTDSMVNMSACCDDLFAILTVTEPLRTYWTLDYLHFSELMSSFASTKSQFICSSSIPDKTLLDKRILPTGFYHKHYFNVDSTNSRATLSCDRIQNERNETKYTIKTLLVSPTTKTTTATTFFF